MFPAGGSFQFANVRTSTRRRASGPQASRDDASPTLSRCAALAAIARSSRRSWPGSFDALAKKNANAHCAPRPARESATAPASASRKPDRRLTRARSAQPAPHHLTARLGRGPAASSRSALRSGLESLTSGDSRHSNELLENIALCGAGRSAITPTDEVGQFSLRCVRHLGAHSS